MEEAVDPFTGGQINGAKYPLERFIGRMLPFWESAGGDEPWRKWMMSTGWTGLSKPMVNPISGEKLDPLNVNGLTLGLERTETGIRIWSV